MMAYCPECGSEVATNTTFCSYCGIALQADVSVDDTPTEPDAASHNELAKEMLPDVLETTEKNVVSKPKANVTPEPDIDDSIPPTPFVLEQNVESVVNNQSKELPENSSKFEKPKTLEAKMM